MIKPSELAFVIISYNTADLLAKCIFSIKSHTLNISYEIIVVDNNSSDDSVQMLRRDFPDVHLIASDKNLGFGVANNIGVSAATSQFVLLLNSDAFLMGDTGSALVSYLKHKPEVGCVGPRVLMPNGDPQPKVFGHLPSVWRIFCQSSGLNILFSDNDLFAGIDVPATQAAESSVGWISGVCMCLPRSVFQSIGGFDPHFFMYCEDIDLCRRIRAHGSDIVHINAHEILHVGGGSTKSDKAKIRNAVHQQRNLLQIVLYEDGKISEIIVRMIVATGLFVRILIGMVSALIGIDKSAFLVQSSWYRIFDLCGGRITWSYD